MDNEAVNELVIYLAHCNRKEHVATVLDMVRREAASREALTAARAYIQDLRQQQGQPAEDPFEMMKPRRPRGLY